MSRQVATAVVVPVVEPRKSKTVCVEDPALTMVEPDTMTPLQFYDRIFAEASLVPEKRLMLAVLEDAIASFQRAFIQPRIALEEGEDFDVEEWLESDDMSWPFSFASICQAKPLLNPANSRRMGPRSWRTVSTIAMVFDSPFKASTLR